MDISRFLNHLAQYSGENTFNPWADHDENYEIEKALAIRRANLKDYLTLRIGGARILLVAEACGYQGGHFSGHRHDLRKNAPGLSPCRYERHGPGP